MISTSFLGLALGLLYWASGGNLWMVILAHGVTDTMGFFWLWLQG